MFNSTELSRSSLSAFTPRNTSRRSIISPGQTSRLFPRSTRLNSRTPKSVISTRVINENSLHRVETYGLALPVQVNEIIGSSSGSQSPITVYIDPAGWAWLVHERRLLVWRYLSTERSKVTFCKEFLLPPTELYHNAKLVCLVRASGMDSQQCGVLVVSPEGTVCYWPNMIHESSPIETCTGLVGQECHSLLEFQPHGYLMTTTTNEILLLYIQKKSILYQHFRQPGGVFSGFGRRMSSFIFGGTDQSSMVVHKVFTKKSNNLESNLRSFYVLRGNNLYKWSVDSRGGSKVFDEKMEDEWSVGKLFQQHSSLTFRVDLNKVKPFCIDAQESSYGVSILCAVLVENPEMDETRMYYFLGSLDVKENSDTYGRFLAFVQLKFAEDYKEELHQQLIDFKLCVPALSKYAFCTVKISSFHFQSIKLTVLNKIEFPQDDESIVGSGSTSENALFFARKHGIILVTVVGNTEIENETVPSSSTNRQLSSMTPLKENSKDDNLTKLREAFLIFCQGNQDEAQTICDEQFGDIGERENGNSLDFACISVGQEIIDDYPASDPRWAEAVPSDSYTSSASLIIIHQLEDKLKAHGYFLQFLKEMLLFQKLSTTQHLGKMVNTRYLLCEQAEKLKFAVALRRQHNKYQEIVDEAIQLVMKNRDLDSSPKDLTQQDLFYREVNRVSDIVPCLLECEKLRLSKQPSQEDHREIIMTVNTVLENALKEVWLYRKGNYEIYGALTTMILSWRFNRGLVGYGIIFLIASSSPDGMRTLILEQLEISSERAFPLAEDQKTKATLVQQLVNLSDIVLVSYVTQLNSLRNFEDQGRFHKINQMFEHDRRSVIYPLVSRGYLEEALSLAEKYRDFHLLIEICEELDDQEKLQNYMNKFRNENFSDVAFKWYMDRGKRSKLMSQPWTQHENLSKFLSSHDHLKWLHDIDRNSFYNAFETLKELSESEKHYIGRKKTLLSLAKLALLASDKDETDHVEKIIQEISNKQTLVMYQESLPIDILQNASLDPVQMAPLTPEELIELLISDVNKQRNENDFMKALTYEATEHERYNMLKLKIWTQALLVDDWNNLKSDDPVLSAKDTVFFKTVENLSRAGHDLHSCLPSMESVLTSDDLITAGLTDNATFQFLLQAAYEQIQRNYIDMDVQM
ncbi:LOW QUALITY PROTEIN: nuclear pore complex protein Nup133-like [Xenia sp. Carnegie-2017]|uniref:LOW QUALITY PROTEIN: nuclear pore complex protein Nup133-like n=1 Tax=Xenia sp. Carnegie-2017 TaxID=2897299 RepID=UPI001F049E63|nr:LOW QUALITY PROTEIN: nuclear pore complex protein Nup133-like [Xenia sp. Carnegie-2017]